MITGANGSGKSWAARRLASVRPDVPVISLDAIKLTTGWSQRPPEEVEAILAERIEQPSWIVEGGPRHLAAATRRADAVIWMDCPAIVRAGRLAMRPWKTFGRTRPELPDGNVDWPLRQYRFAVRSLLRGAKVHEAICALLRDAEGPEIWRCRDEADLDAVLHRWARCYS